jgi:hypothetical protein
MRNDRPERPNAVKNQFIVSNARRLDKGALLGSFDLEAPCGIKIIGAMLFEKNGKRWINFPSKEWTKDDGSKGYWPLLEWTDKGARERFQQAVLPWRPHFPLDCRFSLAGTHQTGLASTRSR